MVRNSALAIIVFISLVSTINTLDCILDDKKAAWWAAIKLPGETDGDKKSYLYNGNTIGGSTFEYSNDGAIDTRGSPLYSTFKSVTKSMNLLAWDDEQPGGETSSSGAHSKGVLAYDPNSDTGFYVLHSVPKYPAISSSGTIDTDIPSAENIYGQSFICVSLNGKEMDKIVSGLRITKINVFYNSFSGSSLPENMAKIANQDYYDGSQDSLSFTVSTVGGPSILAVFKNYKYEVAPYQDLLSSVLKQDIFVESWGRPYSPSNCKTSSGNFVKNVKQITYNSISWEDTKDHSKWCVTSTYACINGMNNMKSQEKRGGTFLCLKCPALQKSLSALISDSQECSSKFLEFE